MKSCSYCNIPQAVLVAAGMNVVGQQQTNKLELRKQITDKPITIITLDLSDR